MAAGSRLPRSSLDRLLQYIQKLKLTGEFISQFGNEGSSDGQFKEPMGLELSQSGLLFVCDCGNHRIQVFQNEQFSYCFGQHGTEPGSFNRPFDLTFNDSEDHLFITESGNDRVQVFTPRGQFLQVFGNFTGVPFKLHLPVGIHYTPDGHLLISSCGNSCVLVFEEDGKFTSAIEGVGDPRVSMMDNGQIVIADQSRYQLQVF